MPETRRIVRWVEVEYQPNLERPAKPVPLGVVLEESRGKTRRVLIVGRVPGPQPPSELQLAGVWGPFLEIAKDWVTLFGKGVNEFFQNPNQSGGAIDMLAAEWRWNLYVKSPQATATPRSLEALGHRLFEKYVGARFPTGKGSPQRVAARQRGYGTVQHLRQQAFA